MACYNNECCAYDSLGNPTMYRCHSLEWTKARKLARFGANTFEYNASGIRIKKNDTVYTLAGTKILKETTGSNTITYYYGTGIAPIGFNYNGTDYYFRKNIQGDVVAIYDTEGYIVAKYVYDAWGNHKIYDANNNEVTSTTHIGFINPIRYRGYYFDVETNLYYLQTRYYDPETGRFLNLDAIEYLAPEQLGGLNLYAYCNNNPTMFFDPCGTISTEAAIVIIAIVVLLVISIDHALGKYAPDGLAVYDDKGEDGFHDQFLYLKGSGPKSSEGEFTFVDLQAGLYKGTSITDFGNFSFTTFATAEATAKADFSGFPSIDAGFKASIYTISYENSFNFWNITVNVSGALHYGYIGGGLHFDFENKMFKIESPTKGMGASFGIDFD